MNVLLVHGFGNRGRVFHRLEQRLAGQGHRCFAPSLTPCDARDGLRDLASKLADQVRRNLPVQAPLAVVGFSMGCLVAKAFLVERPNDGSIRAFFAISGPLQGSLLAWLYPGQGARDMRPGSPFLRSLAAATPGTRPFPSFNYFTPLDLMILPPWSARETGARELRVWAPFHRAMLWHDTVAGDITRRLSELEGGEPVGKAQGIIRQAGNPPA